MSRSKNALLALLVVMILAIGAGRVAAQYQSSSKYGTSGVQAPSVSGQTPPATLPAAELARPEVNVSSQAATQFERNPVLSLPGVFGHQWSPGEEFAPEGLISERYLRTQDTTARKLSSETRA